MPANRRLLSVLGGSLATTVDPNLQNTFTRQTTAYVEREVAANFGVRTGFVWNGRRQVRATINQNRPLNAYNVPVTIQDPGPDGRLGTGDDGSTFTAYNLSASAPHGAGERHDEHSSRQRLLHMGDYGDETRDGPLVAAGELRRDVEPGNHARWRSLVHAERVD
jgi:hypothetical protein